MSISTLQATIDNQNKVKEFVSKHVFYCATDMVKYILYKSENEQEVSPPFTHDDILLNYRTSCPECGEEFVPPSAYALDFECECDCGCIFSQHDTETWLNEDNIFNWYFVSNEAARWLHVHGESTIRNRNIWGRTTAGQAIYLDGVFWRIALERGIITEDYGNENNTAY